MELHDNMSDFPKNIHIENEEKIKIFSKWMFILV